MAEPDATEADRGLRVQAEASSPRAEALFCTEVRSPPLSGCACACVACICVGAALYTVRTPQILRWVLTVEMLCESSGDCLVFHISGGGGGGGKKVFFLGGGRGREGPTGVRHRSGGAGGTREKKSSSSAATQRSVEANWR